LKKATETPLYQVIANDIRDMITANTFDLDKPISTEKEICQRYNVSRITAKHALNKLVDDGLLYRKRGQGSFVMGPQNVEDLPGSKTGKVFALLIPFKIAHGGMYKAVDSASQILSGHWHQLAIHSSSSLERDTELLNQLYTQKVDGVIYYPRSLDLPYDALNAFAKRNIPVIILDQTFPYKNLSSVVCDHYQGGYMLAEHLISYGHKQICYLSRNKPEGLTTVHARYSGYVDCMKANGITAEPRFVHWLTDEPNEHHMLKHIINGLCIDGITAILCETDEVAFNVYMCCINLGLDVPRDMNITGFDNIEWATTGSTQITTIDQNFTLIGEAIADVLLQESYVPLRQVIPVTMIPRHSTNKVV